MESHIEQYQQVHKDNYVKACEELIKNNTKALIYDDIFPLFDKPPLDSMDVIRTKLISFAKEHKTILPIEVLTEVLEKYQISMKKELEKQGKYREKNLLKFVESFATESSENVKILKKDLLQIDKQIQKSVKKSLQENSEKYLLQPLPKLYKEVKEEEKELIIKKMHDFIHKKYIKQIVDSLDIKILVKDTTLLNGIKEQTNRYLFTLENSHLFD